MIRSRTRGAARVALLCALYAAAGRAVAGQPLVTEDADVLAARACEWESFAARLRGAEVERGLTWQTQLGCGVGSGLQLSASFTREAPRGPGSEKAGVAGKLGVFESEDRALRAALTLGFNLFRQGGTAFSLEDHGLNLVLTHRVSASWTAHANLGWAHEWSPHRSSTLWNIAIERRLSTGLEAVGEMFGDDRGDRWISTGLKWSPTATSSVAAAFSLRREGPAARLFTAAYKLSF